MNILSLEHITKSYTGRLLFDDTSFFLHEGEKVGIIGINGTGKSTLLRMIAMQEEPDDGKATLAGNMVIRYLSQNPVFDPEKSVLDSVIQDTENEISDMEATNWNRESEAKSMLTRLGITNFSQKTGELSGGQRKRLALVRVLISPSDILVLDEPTNHLDSEMSTYLEEKLRDYRGSIVMVTHDRYFLDAVANRIVELDKGKLYSYDENYSGYLIRKAEREDSMIAAERKRQSILRKEIAWIQRGARARSTKQKAHIQRYEKLRDMEAPVFDAKVEMSSVTSRLGKTTVELENLSKAYGDKVLLNDFTYRFLKDDRIGFVGRNGCGKTTLMKMIIGEVKPDSGNIIIGQTVKIGYYTQEIANDPKAGIAYMDPKLRVIDYIKNTAEYVQTTDGTVSASVMLERFLFTAEQQYSLIAKLSGGEKRRLNLLRVLMEAPNVLILDEPTNDLDIATLQILEDYLDSFAGIVITVSHDRYFLDRIVNRIFAFENGGSLRQYEGGYTDYENRRKAEGYDAGGWSTSGSASRGGNGSADAISNGGTGAKGSTSNNDATGNTDAVKDKNSGRAHQQKLKFSFKEQKEFETIDDDISKLEDKLADIEKQVAANATNSVKLMELMELQNQTQALLDEKMDRWVYLNELAEKIAEQNS